MRYFCGDMIPKWQTGIVRSITQVTPNTRLYRLELPEVEVFDYKPGQFVTLDLPIHEQRNKRWRSYSIASVPDGGNMIELLIVQLEGGAGTGYMFEQVGVGDSVTLRGPQGVFTTPEVQDKELFFICTGTGVAPFRSMVQDLRQKGAKGYRIHLIYGTRTEADVLYREELEALQGELEGFKSYITLSRQEWDGHKGDVHPIYEALCADRPAAKFMLCGWRPMVDEARERILAMGYDSKDIQIEIYG
jgi:ferredoxin-NADP reductase